MYGQSVPGVFVALWLVWLAVMIAALVAFFRGMSALAQIPARLERIERALATRAPDSTERLT